MTLLHRVVLIVLVALLPAFAAEIYNQQALRSAQRAELDDEAVREARAVSAELGRILDGTRNALVALAALPAIRDQDATACAPLLANIRGSFAGISVLALIGGNDRVVCASTAPHGTSRPPSEWPHVRLAREADRFVVAGYLYGTWVQVPELATARPLDPGAPPGPGARDRPQPVLIANIGLDWVAQQMRPLAAQAGANITVVDGNGLVLVSVPQGPPPGALLDGAERDLLAQGRATARARGPDGQMHSLGMARMPGLSVLVRLDHSAAAAVQVRAAYRSFAMFGAGLVAALCGAFLLARRTLVAPVEGILRAIASWRGGNAMARVPPMDDRSELGRIGAALNELLAAFERIEAGLLASRAALEDRVAERTRQLRAEVREREQAQARLLQAQRMEVIGQLAGGVAHDFNNLLAAIIGNLELAGLRIRDRPEVARLLDSAMRAADRGAALTQRMLAFGRQQYLRLQPTDVAALLSGTADLLAATLGSTIAVQVDPAADLWLARADANQIELLVLNLAINARDAMPRGGTLAITARNERIEDTAAHPARLAPGEYVCISLRDDGVGIEPATLARVTEPFFTTKPVGKGSGLGLSMAHGVAAQSGGGLVVESEVGQGTTVSVWLPRALSEQTPTPPAAGDPDPGTHAAIAGLLVLLVDDDSEVAQVTQQCLEEAGIDVLRRADPEAALALLHGSTPVDLLIADLAMPGMNGVQLATRARARRPGLPVLLATGYADAAALQAADPRFPVLEKPFRSAQLLEAVARLARRRGGRPGQRNAVTLKSATPPTPP